MIETSRRFFLIGSAAALGAAILPKGALASVLVPSPVEYLVRLISSIEVYPNESARSAPIIFDIKVEGRTLIEYMLPPYATCFSWHAPPGGEIVRLASQALEIGYSGPLEGCSLSMICEDRFGSGAPALILEKHDLPSRGPAEIIPLTVDNSPR